MTQRPGRLGVGIIGAGRVGPILGAALAGAGHAIVGINAISQASRDRAEVILPLVPILTVPQIVERSELVILAVPDTELEGLVSGLAATRTWRPGQLVLHTSARYGIDVLAPALAGGAIPLAIHPAMAFTGTSLDLTRLTDSYFAVTAPAPVLPIGQALVVEMGGEPIIVAEGDRASYAEAVETATAFSTSIVEQATRLLSDIGVESPGAVIGPLVRSAMENALGRLSPEPFDLTALDGLQERTLRDRLDDGPRERFNEQDPEDE
ncbi:Rossmann-like and DUF2520 domain-containing protein [Cryobacterium roopkundense]|uniref:Putative short-subunit dehydrogenase-like oxidoreductase (DUF2520 family) n=1 Tax=Cryobacterium roopkundense TaxID=1001240 RepID=A0A7W9A0F2_9MICO|nr:DUF2520 domain-containing protein [Cryobacterium roopkundense]MBB5643578.1 putative short-subunit dehydrogenase-like oxidoreductase (DUF2520 family) [Cryobacterium roopkundense]